MKQPAIYIVTNKRNGTLYTGTTAYLTQRIYQHKNPIKDCFTKRYGCNQLVYYELFHIMNDAIDRETQIKKYSRKKKLQLIEKMNPEWRDMYTDIIGY